MKHAITVVSVSSVNIEAHIRAIERTARELPMACRKLLLTSERVVPAWSGETQSFPLIHDLVDYSQCITWYLATRIETDFALVVQADGYALDGRNWMTEFLNYDYIGAPWPVWHCRSLKWRVGNGGFSLRSKRWMEAAAELSIGSMPEDRACCVAFRQHFERKGCKVAPVELALHFSCEHRLPSHPLWKDRQSFGFHGRHHTGEKWANRFWSLAGIRRNYS